VPEDLGSAAARLGGGAAAVLTELAGGTSMCAVARSGRSFPAAKYHEGRLAAATEVRRALRDLGDHADPATTLAAARGRWARTSPPLLRSTADGEAYGAGGDDALAELTAALAAGEAAPA
jgi:hypothetical protein